MSFWHVTKWVGLVLLVLVLALGLASLFSGEEHDQPAGPTSPGDYVTRQIVPWVILAAAVAGLVAGRLLSARSRATREALGRDVRFFGTVSVTSTALAFAVALGLGVSVTSGACCGPITVSNETLFVLLALSGLMGVLAVLALLAHGTKKVLEAHYDLKRTAALLQDTVERLAGSPPKPAAN